MQTLMQLQRRFFHGPQLQFFENNFVSLHLSSCLMWVLVLSVQQNWRKWPALRCRFRSLKVAAFLPFSHHPLRCPYLHSELNTPSASPDRALSPGLCSLHKSARPMLFWPTAGQNRTRDFRICLGGAVTRTMTFPFLDAAISLDAG